MMVRGWGWLAVAALLVSCSGAGPVGGAALSDQQLADEATDIRVPPGMKVVDRPRVLFPEAVAVDLVVEPDGVKVPSEPAESARLVAEGLDPALPGGALVHRLTPAERTRFDELFYRRTVVRWPPPSDAASIAACCVPHHEFRFYDQAGREIGRVSICFCCSCMVIENAKGVRQYSNAMTLVSGETRFRYAAMKTFIRGMGYRTDYYCPERAHEP